MEEFKIIIQCDRFQKTVFTAHKLLDFLKIHGINRGSITTEYIVNSLEQLWFLLNGRLKSQTHMKKMKAVYIFKGIH